MSNLPFKKFRKKLNEQRSSESDLGDEYKKLSPVMKGAINDVYSMINNTPDPVVNKIQGIIETAANQGAIFNDKNEANLIYEKIKAIYAGTYFGDIDTILKESALSYAKFINLFTNSKIVLIFGIVIASVIYSLKKIKNDQL